MKARLTAWILRLMIGSFLVFALRALAGKGAMRQPMALAGACLMTLLLLEPLRMEKIELEALLELTEDAEAVVSMAIEQSLRDSEDALTEAIAQELEHSLLTEGISCDVHLSCQDGRLTAAAFRCALADVEKAHRILTARTGLEGEQIEYEGELTDGSR